MYCERFQSGLLFSLSAFNSLQKTTFVHINFYAFTANYSEVSGVHLPLFRSEHKQRLASKVKILWPMLFNDFEVDLVFETYKGKQD